MPFSRRPATRRFRRYGSVLPSIHRTTSTAAARWAEELDARQATPLNLRLACAEHVSSFVGRASFVQPEKIKEVRQLVALSRIVKHLSSLAAALSLFTALRWQRAETHVWW